jgi:hypothetical protein
MYWQQYSIDTVSTKLLRIFYYAQNKENIKYLPMVTIFNYLFYELKQNMNKILLKMALMHEYTITLYDYWTYMKYPGTLRLI